MGVVEDLAAAVEEEEVGEVVIVPGGEVVVVAVAVAVAVAVVEIGFPLRDMLCVSERLASNRFHAGIR